MWGDFCSECGAPLSGEFPRACDKGHVTYLYSLNVVVVLPIVSLGQGNGLVTVRRNIEPYKHEITLVSGFVDAGETAMEAAFRELKEETGIKGRGGKFLFQYSLTANESRDPRPSLLNFVEISDINFGDVDTAFTNAETQSVEILQISRKEPYLTNATGESVNLPVVHEQVVEYLKRLEPPECCAPVT